MKSLDSDPSKHTCAVVSQKQGGIETSAFTCWGSFRGKVLVIKEKKEDTNNKMMTASCGECSRPWAQHWCQLMWSLSRAHCHRGGFACSVAELLSSKHTACPALLKWVTAISLPLSLADLISSEGEEVIVSWNKALGFKKWFLMLPSSPVQQKNPLRKLDLQEVLSKGKSQK